MLEATLAVALGLFLLIGSIELLRISYIRLSARYSVAQAARWASMLQFSGAEEDRVAAIQQDVFRRAKQLGVRFHQAHVRICPLEYRRCRTQRGGGAEQFFIVSLEFSEPLLLFPDYVIHQRLEAVAQNEPK